MDNDDQLDRLERSLITGRINRRGFIAGAVATGLVSATSARALADDPHRLGRALGARAVAGSGRRRGGASGARLAGRGRGPGDVAPRGAQ